MTSAALLLCFVLSATALPSRLRIDPPSDKSQRLDASGRYAKVDMDQPFNFNNEAVYTFWISPHGFISMADPKQEVAAYPFNSTVRELKHLRRRLLAALLTRVDMSASEAVRYRMVSKKDTAMDCRMRNVLSRLNKEIEILFPENNDFQIEQMLVVNWDNMRQQKLGAARNSFEMAVVTDGRNSFVLFNFLDIQWVRGAALEGGGGDPLAQSGVSDGEKAVYALPMSGKDNAALYKTSTNVATPGMWLLKTGSLDLKNEFQNPKVEYSRERLLEVRDSLGFGDNSPDPCQTSSASPKRSTTQRPSTRPSRPSRPSTRPSQPSQSSRPSTRPSQPSRPSTRPSQPSRPSTRPSQPSRPSTRPSQSSRPSTRPSQPSRSSRPSQPSTSVRTPLAFRARTCADLRCEFSCDNVNSEPCCRCHPGSFGDGLSCFELETARIYVTGPVSFSVVGYPRSEGQLVLQGRTNRDASRGYVRFEGSKDATSIAQIIVPLFVTPIWYSSRPEGGGINAIQLSGMKLKRQTNVDIPGLGRFAIKQSVERIGRDAQGKWDTTVTGTLDDRVPLPAPVENVKIQHVTMKFLRPGIITSAWTSDVKAGDRTYSVKWTEEITYDPSCPSLNIPKTFTLYTKGLYAARIQPTAAYYLSDAVVREGEPDTNPCAYPEVKCPGAKELCVVTSATTHDCRCEAGFEMRTRACVDIDECLSGRSRCDSNAICVNRPGSYSCQCKPGFQGDGFRCNRINAVCDRCARVGGECVLVRQGKYGCRCKAGYEGDGFTCNERGAENSCKKQCHYFATCVNGECKCKPGLVGNGLRCFECSVSEGPRCHANAACFFDDKLYYYRCKCRDGFRGDGISSCVSNDFDCARCDQNADCVDGAFCRCRAGFRDMSGNGRVCARECNQPCHPKATCEVDGQCRCRPDYIGDGASCRFNCALCDRNADCVPESGCRCRNNFRGDGRVCAIDHECARDSDCGKNGACVGVPLPGAGSASRRQCACQRGHVREGRLCVRLNVRLQILPSEPMEVNEGDQVVLKCQILEGGLLVGSLIWSKEGSPSLRAGIRTGIEPGLRIKQLIIIEARPEDSGRYVCRGDRVEVENYMRVKPNPCDRKCHTFGFCDKTERQCRCHVGYRGDGVTSCLREVCSQFPEICDKNSRCLKDVCVCNPGYQKRNKKCVEIPDCRTQNDCHKDADCVNKGPSYMCRCKNGFRGDGKKRCERIKLGCNLINRCVANAECVFRSGKYECRCMEGYFGAGELKCEKRYDCDKVKAPCGPKSVCQKARRYDDRSQATVTVGVCECLPGYQLIERRCHQKDSVNATIFMSQGSLIYKVPVVTTETRKPAIWMPNSVNGFSLLVIAVATDCNERRIYWTSRNRGPSIFSAPEAKPSGKRTVSRNSGQVEGVSVDWIAGNVFFTNPHPYKPTISVVTRDGAQQRVLIRDNLKQPRALAVDPMNGKIYWSDWDRANPRVESANMDGTDRRIVAEQLNGLPNGLVFDFQQRRLCWLLADKKTGSRNSSSIFCIRPGVEPAPTRVFFEPSGRPFALTYFPPKFYFTDWNRLRLQAVEGQARMEMPRMPRSSSSQLYGLSVLPPRCPAGSNMCSRRDNSYGGCRYLCLPLPAGARVCTCPESLKNCQPTL